MSLKKQLLIFLAACLVFAALYAVLCALIDPFGVFGDVIFDYYEYNMTENPRVAKIAYIDRHHDEYDSYIFGCSKASSYPTEELNEYLGASFYNMFTYGSDLADAEKMALYVLDNYEVKNLVLEISPEAAYTYDAEEDSYKNNLHCKVDERVNPLLFYGKYLFLSPVYLKDKLSSYFNQSYLPDKTRVFSAETGAYNKVLRDSAPISDLESYLENASGAEFDMNYKRPLAYIDEAAESVASIKKKCDEKGVNLIMIGSPMYDAEWNCYEKEEVGLFLEKLTEISDFYCFWGYNTFSHDARYFYDAYHFRNCVGSAVLASVFGGDGYVPDAFGYLLTHENFSSALDEMYDSGRGTDEVLSLKVPILMYHALTNDPSEASDTVITAEKFEEQIAALAEAGYTAVFYSDLCDYVYGGANLPDNPILITFDDGYESNLTIAMPILEKYGMCATVAVIGVSEGKDTYKDTGVPIIPHFSLDAAKEAYDSGIMDFQSHTYDMHRSETLDAEYREGVLQTEKESEKEYIAALREDFGTSKSELEAGIGNKVFVMTYPYGKYSELTEVIMMQSGAKVSVTVSEHINEISKGLPQSLRALGRLNMDDNVSGSALLRRLADLIYG
ncbi:MAG: polysaccharide deacetylase family protein [Eubacteriales bacterium]